MCNRAWSWILLVATAGCAAGKAPTTDTDGRDTVVTDTDPVDTGARDTDATDTDALDTDAPDTDLAGGDTDPAADTDAADTDVVDPSAFAVTIAPTHPTTSDDLVATVVNIPPGIGGMAGLLIVWSGPAPVPVFGTTVDHTLTEPGDSWTVTVHPVAATAIPDVEATVVIGP
jgi:hypothetical protein